MFKRLVFISYVVFAYGCGQEHSKPPEEKLSENFPDSTYACMAANTTATYVPYALTCDKSGDTVIVHFQSGGHLSGHQIGATKSMLEYSAIDTRDNEWHITIAK